VKQWHHDLKYSEAFKCISIYILFKYLYKDLDADLDTTVKALIKIYLIFNKFTYLLV